MCTRTKAILKITDGSLVVGRNWCTGTECGRPNAPSGVGYELCYGIHAEEDAIFNAVGLGYDPMNFDKMVISREPCRHCQAVLKVWEIPWEVDLEMM